MGHHRAAATILEPTQSIEGRSQVALGDAWWQAVYAIPAREHFGLFDDASDPRGRRGSLVKASRARSGQSLQWIGGAFGELAAPANGDAVVRIERSIVLPNKGKATVFLPLLNANFDNLVNDPDDPNNLVGNLSVEQMQRKLKTLLNKSDAGGWVSDLFASVDGRSHSQLFRHRQASEAAFTYTAPFPVAKGLLSAGGFTDESYLDNADADPIQLKELAVENSVTISPAVADGYWLAVDIEGGSHRLRFGGSLRFGETAEMTMEVTYNILRSVEGSDDPDLLIGNSGPDFLEGGRHRDDLDGRKGEDLIVGGKGADRITGGRGQDQLWGDDGEDTFLFRQGDGRDSLFDFEAGDRVLCPELNRPIRVREIQLASGTEAAELDYGAGDVLTFVGLGLQDLSIQTGRIVMA